MNENTDQKDIDVLPSDPMFTSLYQMKICDQIENDLRSKGGKHVSVIMPAGTGAHITGALIVQRSLKNYRLIHVLTADKHMQTVTKDVFERCGIDNSVQYYTASDYFTAYHSVPDFVLLIRVDQLLRLKFAKQYKDVITVSIGDISGIDALGFQTDSIQEDLIRISRQEGLAYQKTLVNQRADMSVFISSSVIDIRDITYASPEEKDDLYGQLETSLQRLSKYSEDLNSLSDPEKIDLQIKSRLSVRCAGSAVAERYSYEKRFKEMQNGLQTEIDIVGAQRDFYRQVSIGCGIKPEDLQKQLDYVIEEKQKLELLLQEDNIDAEKTISEYQNNVTQTIWNLTKNVINVSNQNLYLSSLKEDMSEYVWNHLEDQSRRYLLTAWQTYDAMTKMANHFDLDYSGPCLLATKAFDNEMSKRFYVKYCSYLQAHNIPVSQWPDALHNKLDPSRQCRQEDFTLGSIRFVIGADQYGNIKNPAVFRQCIDYSKRELFNHRISHKGIKNRLKKIVAYAEKVRTDYRNPSAHRNVIRENTAEECMQYLVMTENKLKEILQDMRV